MRDNPKALRWLKEGKKRFASEGFKGINVKEMSSSLGVAKTSFYFLFKSKEEYLKQLYDYWVEDGSIRIINIISVIDDPHARFKKLFELALSNIENEKFLFQMRDYARSCKYTASVLKKVENKRLKLLTNILIEMGYSKSLAKKTAKDIYIFTLGFYEFHKNSRITPKLVKETVNEMIILYQIK
jgi:AcrR family transcriptional regulator